MEQLTGFGKTIIATDPDKIRLDQKVKSILAYKPLLDERIVGTGKVEKLKQYGLKLTKEVESEVADMCTYATAMENRGIEKGLKALVHSLKK